MALSSNHVVGKEEKTNYSGIFATVCSYIFRVLVLLVSAPIYLVLWCINFIKCSLGMLLFWIVGKACLVLGSLFLLGGLAYIHLISEQTMQSAYNWMATHVMNLNYSESGSVLNLIMPYPQVEAWIMLALIVLTATVATFKRDEL